MRLCIDLLSFALLGAAVGLHTPGSTWKRRHVVAGATGLLGSELALSHVHGAAASNELSMDSLLPSQAITDLEAGRVAVIHDWLPRDEAKALFADAEACFQGGHFKLDALAQKAVATKGSLEPGFDRMAMPSFFPSKGTAGPFVLPIGDHEVRTRFRERATALRTLLSGRLSGRPTLAEETGLTHELGYTRYGPGAFLPRHTDEHHPTLKKAHPVASGDENLKRLTAEARGANSAVPTRRSVTWLVYLNDDWHSSDGGELRVHERAAPSVSPVGAHGGDLQVGWLRATAVHPETPVFLDARRAWLDGSSIANDACMLYACLADGTSRDLSARPFAASPALYLAGGDFFARRLLIDRRADAERFHLVDAPKSAAAALLPKVSDAGEDGGERVRDVLPQAGTLVLFDSVAVPHEVLPTRGRPRYAISGWYHEQVAYS